MSDQYIQRLRKIRNELDAVRSALIYVERHWHRQAIFNDVIDLTQNDFIVAARNIEATYIVRLYAEFEGILKDHLATNHPQLTVPAKPKVDWLIQSVIRAEGLIIQRPLRDKLDTVRDYRNSIAHAPQHGGYVLPFTDALSILNTFLAKLP